MVKAVDIETELSGLKVIEGRTPATPEEELGPAFATLATTEDGGVFAGSFVGESAWERHRNGDELVQILKGHATVTVLQGDEEHVLDMPAGSVVVVPRGCWHRFQAPDGCTVMTMTPQPTDHTAIDPRDQSGL
ncbi:MAG: cupin domain-containing protein [Rhodospirillales bacterium]